MNKQPVHSIRIGKARVSIFSNPVQIDGKEVKMLKAAPEIRFRDRFGKWRGTKSMSVTELPKVILALQEALEWMLKKSTMESAKKPKS